MVNAPNNTAVVAPPGIPSASVGTKFALAAALFADSGLAFDRLLCGHGWSHDLDADSFHRHLVDLVEWMPTQR